MWGAHLAMLNITPGRAQRSIQAGRHGTHLSYIKSKHRTSSTITPT